jgi:hypothetical protein
MLNSFRRIFLRKLMPAVKTMMHFTDADRVIAQEKTKKGAEPVDRFSDRRSPRVPFSIVSIFPSPAELLTQ